MKMHIVVAALFLLALATPASAFAPPVTARRCHVNLRIYAETITATTDFGTAMPSKDPYVQFGLTDQDELALGVDINELVQWVGTKENLIVRVQGDVTALSREQAEEEVSKLLLDAEILQRVLFYEKNKEEIASRGLGNDAGGTTIGTYALWLGVGALIPSLKRTFVDPKFESGEWEKIRITDYLTFLPKFGETTATTSADVVDAVVSSPAAAVVDSVTSAVMDSASDAISNSL